MNHAVNYPMVNVAHTKPSYTVLNNGNIIVHQNSQQQVQQQSQQNQSNKSQQKSNDFKR